MINLFYKKFLKITSDDVFSYKYSSMMYSFLDLVVPSSFVVLFSLDVLSGFIVLSDFVVLFLLDLLSGFIVLSGLSCAVFA